MNRCRSLRIALLLSLVLGAHAQADDVVLAPGATVRAPGGRLRGTIERETAESIRINGTDVPIDEIAEVEYNAPGVSYTQAALKESGGDLEAAAELFQKAASESTNPLVKQDARFRHAAILGRLALADPSKRDEALAALGSIAKDLKTSRHYGPALERIADLRIAAEEYDEADAALAELASIGWATDRAAVRRAALDVHRGQAEQGLDALDALVDRYPEGSVEHRAAMLARAEALAALGRFDEAERVARAVIDAAAPEDAATLAPAYNTLGDCLRTAGKSRDALFAYLHTDILYSTQPDDHARALAAIAQLWRALNQSDRADEVLDRLRREYPNTPSLSTAEGNP